MNDAADVVAGQTRRIEADAVAAVDLQVEQGGSGPSCFDIDRAILGGNHAGDAALLAADGGAFAGCVVARPKITRGQGDSGKRALRPRALPTCLFVFSLCHPVTLSPLHAGLIPRRG